MSVGPAGHEHALFARTAGNDDGHGFHKRHGNRLAVVFRTENVPGDVMLCLRGSAEASLPFAKGNAGLPAEIVTYAFPRPAFPGQHFGCVLRDDEDDGAAVGPVVPPEPGGYEIQVFRAGVADAHDAGISLNGSHGDHIAFREKTILCVEGRPGT